MMVCSAVKAGAPGNLTVNDVGPHSMELSWSKPRNDGGSPIKGNAVVLCAIFCPQRAAIFVRQLQAFQRDGKYSRGRYVEHINIFHHVGKPAIIAQKLRRVACYKLHMQPRL